MNVSRIEGELWQGSAPNTMADQLFLHRQWDVLVLCAQEFQPEDKYFPGVEVIHAGFDDSGRMPTRGEIAVAKTASEVVADRVARGRRVLVTCWMGLNRSGLVTALALRHLTGMSGADALALVREKRLGALRNDHFARMLQLIPAKRQARARRA